ncbi:MAG: hypothetical protein KY397_02260 [Gemmatimonadetes bacterium]|nr:hypothetical protein [Gemmatimonadota bacterium]
MEQKLEHARAYEARDAIEWTVAIDTVEGALHRALDEKPHSAYFVDREGIVAGRLLWANDLAALSEGLDDLAAGRTLEIRERESKVVPMVRGMGKMHDVLSLAGPQALKDVRREAPPIWLLAWMAGRFRPLSPLGRGVAALGTVAGGLVVGGWVASRLLRNGLTGRS